MKKSIILLCVLFALLSSCNNSSFDNDFVEKQGIMTRTIPDHYLTDKPNSRKDTLWTTQKLSGPESSEFEKPGGVSSDGSFREYINRKVSLSIKDDILIGILDTGLNIDDSSVNNLSKDVRGFEYSCKKGVITFKSTTSNYFVNNLLIVYEDKESIFFHKGNNYMAANRQYIINVDFETPTKSKNSSSSIKYQP